MAWPDEDIELALHWQAEKRMTCTECGHHLDESTSKDGQRLYQAAEITCHACAVIDWRRKALSDQEVDMGGLRVYATKRS